VRRNGAVPYEGHHLLQMSRWRLRVKHAEQLTEFSRESHQPVPVAHATAAGDEERLRGVPCVGRGISGAMRGTRPESTIDVMDTMRRRLAVYDGTSPGTQPEEEALRLVALAEANPPARPSPQVRSQ
jgi:hypothetical protein